MTLTEDQLRKCLFCAVEERQARERGKPPGLARWNDDLIRALDAELALSRTRQCENAIQPHSKHEDWISAREVSEMTGWGLRRVQRHAAKLGARKIGGRLMFSESIIREHIEGSAA
ncbi:hypothetical protein BN000_01485 [Mycobacterium europaeum]|uniref:Helix-turn-helix domain-containing protein n=1 Tax=Mycobacterium europaeum TaxID=761804 RepID=A0A0U1D5A5_9MYCO|nr:hypothetical protein [Mycobacterium europaeum]CQD07435.1 hypothetical protein BN000_01485 [Mycobacterium europaeum]